MTFYSKMGLSSSHFDQSRHPSMQTTQAEHLDHPSNTGCPQKESKKRRQKESLFLEGVRFITDSFEVIKRRETPNSISLCVSYIRKGTPLSAIHPIASSN